jgi:hypothetical protein
MKNTLSIFFISVALIFSGCELAVLGLLEKTTRDKMYDYMQDADEWQITAVTQYEAQRDHPDSSFVVVVDSTWNPKSSIIFKDGKENDEYLHKPLTYIDSSGNSTIAEYDLYPDNENPAFSFYEWDDYPFPHKSGNIYLLEVWEKGKLTIASRIESKWRQYHIILEMEDK